MVSRKPFYLIPMLFFGLSIYAILDYQTTILLKEGNDNYGYGEYDLAISQFTQLLVLQPNNAEAWRLLGRVSVSASLFRQEKKYINNAVDYLKKAVALETNNAENHLYLGIAFQLSQQPQAARQSMQNALTRDPHNTNYLYNYGLLLERQGDRQMAAVYYKKSLAVEVTQVAQLALERVETKTP
jgi:tetratricopeptide (TPR) repeat protein